MWNTVKQAAKKTLFGEGVEKINALEQVKDEKGVTIGKNMRLDFVTGDVWIRVGCLDTEGEEEILPPKDGGKTPGKIVQKLGVVEDGATFEVDEKCTDNEKMHGVYSIWRAPSGFLVQLVRNVGYTATPAPTATTSPVKKR